MWLSAQLQSKRWRGLGLRGVPNASEAARFAIETYGYRGALDVATTLWALARLLGGASGRGPPLRPDTGVPVGVHLNALQRREPKRALLQVTRSNARSSFADKSQPEARARLTPRSLACAKAEHERMLVLKCPPVASVFYRWDETRHGSVGAAPENRG